MFQKFGFLIVRHAPIILIIWGAVLGVLLWTAPRWHDTVLDREFAYLPKDSPSQQGEAMFKQAFPDQYYPSNFAIVVYRPDEVLSRVDFDFIEQSLKPGLRQIADEEGGLADNDGAAAGTSGSSKSIIATIRTFKDLGIGALLVSADQKASLVVLELTTELLQIRNWSTLQKVDDLLARLEREGKMPAGLKTAETGSAAVGRDITVAQAQGRHGHANMDRGFCGRPSIDSLSGAAAGFGSARQSGCRGAGGAKSPDDPGRGRTDRHISGNAGLHGNYPVWNRDRLLPLSDRALSGRTAAR